MSTLAELQWQLYQTESRIEELNKMIEEAPGWGAAVGAMYEEKKGAERAKQHLISAIAHVAVATELSA